MYSAVIEVQRTPFSFSSLLREFDPLGWLSGRKSEDKSPKENTHLTFKGSEATEAHDTIVVTPLPLRGLFYVRMSGNK